MSDLLRAMTSHGGCLFDPLTCARSECPLRFIALLSSGKFLISTPANLLSSTKMLKEDFDLFDHIKAARRNPTF